MTIAALEATLTGPRPPVAQALSAGPENLLNRAERIADRLRAAGIDAGSGPADGAVGGGGAPGVALPGAAVSLPPALAPLLRAGDAVRRGAVPAVVGRVEDGRLLLDLRAVPASDDELLGDAVIAASAAGQG
jgi:L-seryl-tRNA(Ser) seleniumtransferase